MLMTADLTHAPKNLRGIIFQSTKHTFIFLNMSMRESLVGKIPNCSLTDIRTERTESFGRFNELMDPFPFPNV